MTDIETLIFGIFVGIFIAYVWAWIYLKIQMRKAHTEETENGRKSRYRYNYFVFYHYRSAAGSGQGCTLLMRESKISSYNDIESVTEYLREKHHYDGLVIENWRRIKQSRDDLLKTEQEGGEKLE